MRVELFLAAAGNHFMVEIAQLFREGFERVGVASCLRFDEVPQAASPTTIPIVVAPHEFGPLFLKPRFGRAIPRSVLAGAYVLNTEQPGSPWFELACRTSLHARGIFDINVQGVRELLRRGFRTLHTPLGYAPSLEERAQPTNAKEIDLLFLGHHSPKRAEFFARAAGALQEHACRLVFADVQRPRLPDTPNYYAGAARNELVHRSKILINVHSADRRYFEWHRILIALANDCLVVSEPSDGHEPLVDGEHLVFAPLEALAGRCRELLADDAAREAIVRRGRELLLRDLCMTHTCRAMLEELERGLARRGSSWLRRRGFVASRRARRLTRRWQSQLHRLGRSVRAIVPGRPVAPKSPSAIQAGLTSDPTALAEIRRTDHRRLEYVRLLDAAEREGLSTLAEHHTIAANTAFERGGSAAISVIVTLYNYSAYIVECLDSVARARCDGLPGGVEIVVVDDGSTDPSAALVERYMHDSSLPMLLVRKRLNTGLADARNLGVRLAQAPYVFILDADNRIFPACLTKLYRALTSSGKAGAYGILQQFDNATGKGVGLASYLGWDVRALVYGNYIDAMALLARDELLAVGGYSTDLIRYGWFGWEDYDLWLKLAQRGASCELVPEIVAGYRVHEGSMIRTTNYYVRNLAAHFRTKFPALVQASFDPLLFGWARGDLPDPVRMAGAVDPIPRVAVD